MELAAYVDEHVPVISETAFGLRQVPQMNIVGSNFPLGRRVASIALIPDDKVDRSISAKSTHVIIKPTKLFAKLGGFGKTLRRLKPGVQVTLVNTEKDWVLIARDGKKLGYVAKANILFLR